MLSESWKRWDVIINLWIQEEIHDFIISTHIVYDFQTIILVSLQISCVRNELLWKQKQKNEQKIPNFFGIFEMWSKFSISGDTIKVCNRLSLLLTRKKSFFDKFMCLCVAADVCVSQTHAWDFPGSRGCLFWEETSYCNVT